MNLLNALTKRFTPNLEQSVGQLDLHPTLASMVDSAKLDRDALQVRLKCVGKKLDMAAREQVLIGDEERSDVWVVPSLQALFRGERKPPSFQPQPTDAYMPLFYFVEAHVILYCDTFGDATDGEFRDAFSNLRRRPDGKSTSALHFYLWQVAAALVGTRSVSAAEFEGIFTRLTQSASTFRMGVASRNYATTLRNM